MRGDGRLMAAIPVFLIFLLVFLLIFCLLFVVPKSMMNVGKIHEKRIFQEKSKKSSKIFS